MVTRVKASCIQTLYYNVIASTLINNHDIPGDQWAIVRLFASTLINDHGSRLFSSSPATMARAWVTLLTRASYLPGVLLLHYSLQRVRSIYPLVVLATPSLEPSAIAALRALSIEIIEVAPLRPAVPVSLIAERFADTWDKLRALGLPGYERVGLIDGDMLLLRNMDDALAAPLPADWIAAAHACICNWTRDAWAADDWRPWNCGLTHAERAGAPPQPAALGVVPPHPLARINSGLVIISPSPALGAAAEEYLRTSPRVQTFDFPDQNFFDEFFAGRWRALGWDVNAIKTARYWHPRLWTDAGVRNLHYIVDKPWAAPRTAWAADDVVTHGWWWDRFYAWRAECTAQGRDDVVRECERWMFGRKGAPALDGDTDVGPVESWEESVEAEKAGRANGHDWPPGPPWNVEVDGVQW
jgi:inositol 3-alpha-galactosyltransferase